MLNILSRLQSLYHSPTTSPRRITIKAVAPSGPALYCQAEANLSQSTPARLRILAFSAASGNPLAGSRLCQPPLDSGGGYAIDSEVCFSPARDGSAEIRKKSHKTLFSER